MKPFLAWSSALFIAIGAAASATAAPQIFFGETLDPGGTVTGAAATARASFLAGLVGVGSEGFETQTPITEPPDTAVELEVVFVGSAGDITATLQGGGFGVVDAAFDTPDLGRFNTTPDGKQWWLAAQEFTIVFDVPISAFGFFGTDIGDFEGRLTVTLEEEGGDPITLDVGHTVGSPNGSLLFWGFIDQSKTYSKVTFGNTSEGFDAFGFDDMVVGDLGQVSPPPNGVPEPATLALLGAALLGLAAARRRRPSN